MNHIKYLSDYVSICERPDRLGTDFFKNDFIHGGSNCNICSRLLANHNKKVYEEEMTYDHNRDLRAKEKKSETDTEDLFFIGFASGVVMTFIVMLILMDMGLF